MEKIKLKKSFEIENIVQSQKLVNITVETGDENVFILDENKFILKQNFLLASENVFLQCKTLQKINMENFNFSRVTTMKGWFLGCENLREIVFPVEANIADLESLSGCFAQTAMRSIDLSFIRAKYRTIDFQYAFWESQVEEITLPSCTTHNMQGCFSNCGNLEEVIAPVTFKYSNDWMFYKMCYNCPNLKKINLSKGCINHNMFKSKFNQNVNDNNLSGNCLIILP